jgi:hypothetical protein
VKLRLILLFATIGLVAAACSGNGDPAGVASLDDVVAALSPPEQPAAEVDSEQAMLDLAACLRENGIDIEDPTVDADGNVQFGGLRGAAENSGVDPETARAAMEACVENIEGVSLGRRGDDFDVTAFQDALLEFAACMRSNGYDMPDPDFSGGGGGPGGGGGGPFGQIDRADPDFIAAEEACSDIMSGFRGPGGAQRGQG